MDDHTPTRRTALRLLAAGTVATTGIGLTSAAEHEDGRPDDAHPRDPRELIPEDLYVATLSPQDGVESDARGVSAFQLRAGEVTFALVVSRLENTFMAHIHEDEPLGPIAVWLHSFERQDEQVIDGEFNGLLDAGTISDDAIAAGRADDAETQTVDQLIDRMESGTAFVNVHTEAYPDGELAGEIEPFDLEQMLHEHDHEMW